MNTYGHFFSVSKINFAEAFTHTNYTLYGKSMGKGTNNINEFIKIVCNLQLLTYTTVKLVKNFLSINKATTCINFEFLLFLNFWI